MEPLWHIFTESIVPTRSFRVLLLMVSGLAVLRLYHLLTNRLEAMLLRAKKPTEMTGSVKKRIHTLVGILLTVGRFIIWLVIVVLSLDEMGVNIVPIIAGAGIAGLAVGFGAQNLVKDVISGFFIILEDQVCVGDVAVINGREGLVEAITFRTIVLRDVSGVVHIFPNGTISTLSNMTKVWSAYVIDVGVAYKEDTDRVVELMRAVGNEIQRDPVYGPKMIEPIEIFGVDSFGELAVTIKARLKTLPVEQWNVGREYRRRLKKAFDMHGIERPHPHRPVYVSEGMKPTEVLPQRQPPP